MRDNYSTILTGRKLFYARLTWVVLFSFFTIFAIFSIWQSYLLLYRQEGVTMIRWLSASLNHIVTVISWVLALILFIKKSNDRVVILVSIMLFTTTSGSPFFYWVLNHGWGEMHLRHISFSNVTMASSIAMPFGTLSSAITLAVFLTFPNGRWITPRAKYLFLVYIFTLIVVNTYSILMAPYRGLLYLNSSVRSMETLLGTLASLFRFIAGYMLWIHYRNIQNSVQRQQIKWIVVFFFGSVCASVLFALVYTFMNTVIEINPQSSLNFIDDLLPWMGLSSNLIELGLVISFGVAIFRYRLWDIDELINKTLVYGTLSLLLVGIVVISASVVDYAIKQWLGEEPSIWSAIITAVPAATLFNPLRERLQAFVDRRFKPEEVNFSDSFIEFRPEVQEMLTTRQIIQILSEQVKRQLNLDFAKIYLLEEDSFHQAEPAPSSDKQKKLVLEDKSLAQLKEGKVVVDDDGVPYSLLVPLVVPRARIPDFLGVVILGRRLENKGYSTQILKDLQALGAHAGKAIYLSQLSEQAKQKRKRAIK